MRHLFDSAAVIIASLAVGLQAEAGHYRYGPGVNRYGCNYVQSYLNGAAGGNSNTGYVSGSGNYYSNYGGYGGYNGTGRYGSTASSYGLGPYVGPIQPYGGYSPYLPGRIGYSQGYVAPRSVYHDSSGYSYYPGQYHWQGGRLQYTPGQFIYNYGRPGVGVFHR